MISPVSPLQIAGSGFTVSARGERTTVPVAPANYIYSHFKHVSGVPAPKGVQGIAVSKIKILDTLIEHLSQAKMKKGGQSGMDVKTPAGLSEKQLDEMIRFLHSEIESAAAAAAPYKPSPLAPAGAIFNIKI